MMLPKTEKDFARMSTKALREYLVVYKGLRGAIKSYALRASRSEVLGMLLGWSHEQLYDHYDRHYQENLLSDTNGVMQ